MLRPTRGGRHATLLPLARLEQTARNVKGSLVIDRLAFARAVRHTRHFPGMTCSIALDPATGFRTNDQAALARCANRSTEPCHAGRRRRSRTTEREKATMKDDTASPVSRLRALPRPRPATAIALLALMMAMGGTSIAGSVINGSDLKNGTVTRHRVRLECDRFHPARRQRGDRGQDREGGGQLRASGEGRGERRGTGCRLGHLQGARRRWVTASNLAPAAVSWKSLGAQVVAAPPIVLPVGTTQVIPATAAATCPAGTVAISGGESISDTTNAFVNPRFQVQVGAPGAAPTGWAATGGTAGTLPATMTVYAICIAAGS